MAGVAMAILAYFKGRTPSKEDPKLQENINKNKTSLAAEEELRNNINNKEDNQPANAEFFKERK